LTGIVWALGGSEAAWRDEETPVADEGDMAAE
jgi:hypothetical protein